MSSTGEHELRLVDRRSLLRVGGVAAAGAGAAALLPAQRADAVSPAATTTLGEAFAGMTVPPRALERWLCSRSSVLDVVCIGDSILEGSVGSFDFEHGGSGSWVERLALGMGREIGPLLGAGFRGLWRGLDSNDDHEWRQTGTWVRATAAEKFDVCPFGDGFYSRGGAGAVLTWTKPPHVSVAGFDLYWFHMAGTGNWEYRVDGGAWAHMAQPLASPDNKLHKFYVARPVDHSVQIRAYDGHKACLAPIGGLSVYSRDPVGASGVVVHNLGRDANLLSNFVRTTAGDAMAWLDAVVSDPSALKVTPALVIVLFSNDVTFGDTTLWGNDLLELANRVGRYADVLLMNPYEQNGRSVTMQAAYRAATHSVGAAHGCAVLDLYDAWAGAGDTGWAAANAGGLMFDALHPSALGHQDIAGRVWRLLRTFS